MHRGRGYVDKGQLLRILQAANTPTLRAAQRAADAAMQCHEEIRRLPCRRGERSGPTPTGDWCHAGLLPTPPAAKTAPPSRGLRTLRPWMIPAVVGLVAGVLGVAVGRTASDYLAPRIERNRNHGNSDAVREHLGPDGRVAGR